MRGDLSLFFASGRRRAGGRPPLTGRRLIWPLATLLVFDYPSPCHVFL